MAARQRVNLETTTAFGRVLQYSIRELTVEEYARIQGEGMSDDKVAELMDLKIANGAGRWHGAKEAAVIDALLFFRAPGMSQSRREELRQMIENPGQPTPSATADTNPDSAVVG